MSDVIYGRNPVLEALSSGANVDKILIQKNIEGAGKKVYALAKKAGVRIQAVDKKALDRETGTSAHQGVAAYVSEFVYCEISGILEAAKAAGEEPFIVVLDGVEDPHNLGAIIRSADCMGAHGVVIPAHRSASVTATVVKASAGATSHVPVARVVNIVRAIEELQQSGLWIYGLDMDGTDIAAGGPGYDGGVALVIGGEGSGLSRLVKEKCDFILSIPMHGKLNSLNASNAAAIALYELAKARGR